MKVLNIKQEKTKGKSLSKKKFVIIEELNPKRKLKDQSDSKEKYNTVGDIRTKEKKKINKKEKEKENYFVHLSKKKEVLLKINPDKNDKESYPYNIRTKKINKSKENRTYKDYPNLIKGVLGQAVYNNMNNNTNYNEYIRYKPINDIFNEQSSITTRKITIENNNSLNISFNSKSDILKKEKEKNDNENNIYNYYYIENELKLNGDSIKSRKNDTLIKSGKSISPILSNYNNENKKENNELVSEYVNTKSSDKNTKNNKEENNVINKEFNNVEIYSKYEIEKKDNINILLSRKNQLVFKNEEEMWKYIRNKMTEEKEKEYNEGKIKYNYFTLMKKFHGEILYEIGLENNIDEINSILQRENVKVENEPVLFVSKKIYDKINFNVDYDNEIKILKIKNDEIMKENETLKNNTNIIKEETYKLNETINTLNQKLKDLEKEINEKDNTIKEYKRQLEELINKKEQQKEKTTFSIKNDYFEIKSTEINKKNNTYIIENFRHQYKNILKKEEKKEIKINKEENKHIKKNKDINKLDKKEEKKDINNNLKDKINIFNKNNNNNDIKKEENIPNKIFLVNNSKKEETNEEKIKREEKMNRALKRIKNKRKVEEGKDKIKKSEKMKNMSTALETQLPKGEGKKLYVDLEYEKELENEKENN